MSEHNRFSNIYKIIIMKVFHISLIFKGLTKTIRKILVCFWGRGDLGRIFFISSVWGDFENIHEFYTYSTRQLIKLTGGQ